MQSVVLNKLKKGPFVSNKHHLFQNLSKDYQALICAVITEFQKRELGLDTPIQMKKELLRSLGFSPNLARMDELIRSEKLYLQENLSREDLADLLHVDRFQVIMVIRNFLNDAYMPVILNRYRVRHAIDVMKEQPNYTVEAIAKESGFNNVRKFYRIFKDEMGMTPSEYREVLKNKGSGSVLPLKDIYLP